MQGAISPFMPLPAGFQRASRKLNGDSPRRFQAGVMRVVSAAYRDASFTAKPFDGLRTTNVAEALQMVAPHKIIAICHEIGFMSVNNGTRGAR